MTWFSGDKRIDQGHNPSSVELAVGEACPKHFPRQPSNFLFDLHRVKLAFFNLAPALFQQSKDRLVSEALQKERNNAEANHLREKQLPIPAERFSCFTQDVAYASAADGNYQVHKLSFGRNI